MHQNVRVAICGHLPTAHDYLLRQGVGTIHRVMDATELIRESDYHLILIYAPHAEGLLNTACCCTSQNGRKDIPIRLLNEPCCHSALLELKSMLRRISQELDYEACEQVS